MLTTRVLLRTWLHHIWQTSSGLCVAKMTLCALSGKNIYHTKTTSCGMLKNTYCEFLFSIFGCLVAIETVYHSNTSLHFLTLTLFLIISSWRKVEKMEKGDKGSTMIRMVWVGECFFWYWPTRVVPDQRPLNGRCCCCCLIISSCES